LAEEFFVGVGEALGEEEVDPSLFEGGAEAEDEGELAVVEVVAVLFEGGEEVVAGDGAEVEVAHRLLGQALEDFHADFFVGGVHDDWLYWGRWLGCCRSHLLNRDCTRRVQPGR
jgi:hypothetical protein